MTPLVLQLQSEAMDGQSNVCDLLRKARVVAAKLGLEQVEQWIDYETNGYPDPDSLPEYRQASGQLKVLNPFHGWIPAHIADQELELSVTQIAVMDPVASLEETVARTIQNGFGHVAFMLSGCHQQALGKLFGFESQYQLHMSIGLARHVLDSIRNRVLDWSLSLEKSGILGEGMSFTKREREVAAAMSGTTYNIFGNVGVAGDVTNSTVSTNQTTQYSPADVAQIERLASQVEQGLEALPAHVRDGISAEFSRIRSEIDSKIPDHSKITSALISVRKICGGITENLCANGIVAMVAKFIQ